MLVILSSSGPHETMHPPQNTVGGRKGVKGRKGETRKSHRLCIALCFTRHRCFRVISHPMGLSGPCGSVSGKRKHYVIRGALGRLHPDTLGGVGGHI